MGRHINASLFPLVFLAGGNHERDIYVEFADRERESTDSGRLRDYFKLFIVPLNCVSRGNWSHVTDYYFQISEVIWLWIELRAQGFELKLLRHRVELSTCRVKGEQTQQNMQSIPSQFPFRGSLVCRHVLPMKFIKPNLVEPPKS